MSMSTRPEILSVTEAAAILGVSRQRVYYLLDCNRLKGYRIGKVRLVDATALRAMRAEREMAVGRDDD